MGSSSSFLHRATALSPSRPRRKRSQGAAGSLYRDRKDAYDYARVGKAARRTRLPIAELLVTVMAVRRCTFLPRAKNSIPQRLQGNNEPDASPLRFPTTTTQLTNRAIGSDLRC